MGGTSRTLAYQYDRDGDRVTIIHPDGTSFAYAYDGLDRPTYLSAPGPFGLAYTGYEPFGLPGGASRGDGSIISWSYDPIQRPFTSGHMFPDASANVLWITYRNSVGQITATTRINDSYAWTGAYTVNRAYTANGLNQYTVAGGANFGYDANGNLTGDGANTFTYDPENRLVAASGAHAATLSYDPLGRLWQVTAGSSTTRFLYDGDALIAEYDGSGAMQRRYVHWVGADVPVVSYAGASLAAPSYLHADPLGSIVTISGPTGAAINSYDEYGIPGAANQGRFQYTGQAWLAELGMYYYKARFYSPTLGRFMQTDAIGYEGGINLYEYVGDDPVNHTDPSGNDCDSAKGQTTCKTDNYIVRFQTPPGWHDFNSHDRNYHAYSVDGHSPLSTDRTRAWLPNNPTPGFLPAPATKQGSPNDATPILGGGSRSTPISPVVSYLTTNERSGGTVVVNVTLPGHALKDGIVVREAVAGPGGQGLIHNWGEGNASLQRPGGLLAPLLNNVWVTQVPPACVVSGPAGCVPSN